MLKLMFAVALFLSQSSWAELVPIEAPGTYQLSYLKQSVGISWYTGVENPKSGEPFDFTKYGKVPELGPLTVEFDATTLKGKLSGGGHAAPRDCSAKSVDDPLECEPIKLGESTTPDGCKVIQLAHEMFGFDGDRKEFVLTKIYYRDFAPRVCEKEKERILASIKDGTADAFWKSVAESGAVTLTKLEDLVALGHLYRARK